MGTLLIQEAVNLFVGDDGPDNEKRLIISEMKLPDLEEIKEAHHAGGSWGEIEIGGLGMKALMSSFKLKGDDPQTLSQFGMGSRKLIPYTVYGGLRDKRDNSLIQVKAVMRARLSKISSDAFKRGAVKTHDHELAEIMHYELYYNKKEKYYWDFFESEWRVDGVSQVADMNAILAAG